LARSTLANAETSAGAAVALGTGSADATSGAELAAAETLAVNPGCVTEVVAFADADGSIVDALRRDNAMPVVAIAKTASAPIATPIHLRRVLRRSENEVSSDGSSRGDPISTICGTGATTA
jgi:hypothetical protein